MASAAHNTTLKVSGASTAMTGEATTNTTGNVYQITNSAKRIVDPSVAVVVYDGGTPVASTGYTFDYLFGKVTLAAPPGGAVTIDGAYLTMLSIAEVRKLTVAITATLLDKTSFDSSGWRAFLQGLLEWHGSAEMLSTPTTDLDSGTGGTQSFFSFLTGDTAKLIECTRAGAKWRGWVKIEVDEEETSVSDLFTATVSFKGSSAGAGASFAFE